MTNPPMNDKLEAFRLVNQRLLQQNEELLKLLQGPQQAWLAQGGPPQGEHQHLDPLRKVNEGG